MFWRTPAGNLIVHFFSKLKDTSVGFDTSALDEAGLLGPPGGKRALAYELCIPNSAERRTEVEGIDPSVAFSSASPAHNGCGEKTEGIKYFGMMIMGMGIMSAAMTPLRSYEPFMVFLKNIERPLLGILAGAVFTGLVKSSAATVGIASLWLYLRWPWNKSAGSSEASQTKPNQKQRKTPQRGHPRGV